MMALPRGRLLAAWGALARQAGTAPHAMPARCGALRALSSETELPAAAPAPSTKARPIPDATELRRQMVAYKTQVHELRLQYQQELKGKEAAKKAARLAAATATRHGAYQPHATCVAVLRILACSARPHAEPLVASD